MAAFGIYVHLNIQRDLPCVAWDSSPLVLQQQGQVPDTILKALPYFLGDGSVCLEDHIQDVANLCTVHNVTTEHHVLLLLASSLKGKAKEWYKSL